MEKRGHVYILANRRNGALYTGVTSDLAKRIYQHREALMPGFTADHGIKRLVWFETHDRIEPAIRREKQIKKWNRAWKIRLIETANPDWHDLAVTVLGLPPISRHPQSDDHSLVVAAPSPESAGDGSPPSRG